MDKNVFAFLMTLGAGLATVLGSFAVFIAHKFHGKNYRRFLAGIINII